MDDLNEMAKNHSAGATVRHRSPFDDLPTHRNAFQLEQAFAEKWVRPYYMKIGSSETSWIDNIKSIKEEINQDVVSDLLGDYNWRTRLVGAYFSAVCGYDSFTDIIGIHLLKSELCCVGHIYALILADFNSEKSIEYLHKYLAYYLTMPNLYFDQDSVLAAMIYIDNVNGTSEAGLYASAFDEMQEERKRISIESAMASVEMLRKLDPNFNVETYLQNTRNHTVKLFADLQTSWIEKQIAILKELRQYSH